MANPLRYARKGHTARKDALAFGKMNESGRTARREASDPRSQKSPIGYKNEAVFVSVGWSKAFRNKPPRTVPSSAYTDYKTTRITIRALIDHIRAGYPFTPAIFKADYRKEDNFKAAQVIGIDLDGVGVETVKRHPVVSAHAFLIYPTASSTPAEPRSRALFRLDSALDTVEQYKVATRRLIQLCADLHPDDKPKSAAQIWYGSTNPESDHQNPSAVLPLKLLEPVAVDDTPAPTPEPVARTPFAPPAGYWKVDTELARIAFKIGLFAAWRVWTIARGADVAGRGLISRDALWEAVQAAGLFSTRQNMNEQLRNGQGVFFYTRNDGLIRLISFKKAALFVADHVPADQRAAVVGTNRPGSLPLAYVDIGGDITRAESRVYAAWVSLKENRAARQHGYVEIGRATLEMLWASANTLRHWETLSGVGGEKRYVEYADASAAPAHAYDVFDEKGKRYKVARTTNRYHAPAVVQHPRKGQRRKVLTAVNAVMRNPFNPADKNDGGSATGRQNFYDSKMLSGRERAENHLNKYRDGHERPHAVHVRSHTAKHTGKHHRAGDRIYILAHTQTGRIAVTSGYYTGGA